MKSYQSQYAEYSTSLPARLPDFDGEPSKDKNKPVLRPFHYAKLLDTIAALPVEEQDAVSENMLRYLKKLTKLIVTDRAQFSSNVIKTLFHALPNLPLEDNDKDYQDFLNLVLQRALHLFKNDPFTEGGSVVVLCAIAKLGINLTTHTKLITKLLEPFLGQNSELDSLTPAGLGQLWQFCAYASCVKYQLADITRLKAVIENKLPEQTVTISNFHKKVVSVLKNLLNDAHLDDLTIEYPVGNYSLDIAFPESMINVEVDGPTHYRDKVLIRNSRFRDLVLAPWKVIRIPYFDWKEFKEEQRIDFLLKQLAAHPHLLNRQNQKRLLKLMPSVKPDLLFSSAANQIPVAPTQEKIQAILRDTPAIESQPEAEKAYTLSTSYLNDVFANKLHGSFKVKLVTNEKGRFFQLGSCKVKKKERRGIEALAESAQLDITFKLSEKYPGQYRIHIAKDSPALTTLRQQARDIKSVSRFFESIKGSDTEQEVMSTIQAYSMG
jgi:very-short-patch-repair endonuclease